MRPAITVFLTLLLAVTLSRESALTDERKTSGPSDRSKLAQEMIPAGMTLALGSDSAIPFVGLDNQGNVVWKAVLSQVCAPTLRGYAGPVPILAGIDSEGNVTGIRILEHQETPTFVRGIEDAWFLDQFKGKTLSSPLRPFEDFDGITHATVTVKAICSGVRASLHYAAHPGSTFQEPDQASSEKNVVPIAGLCLAVVAIFLENAISRILTSAIILLLLGFLTQQFLSLAHLPIFLGNFRNLMGLPLPLLALWGVSALAILVRVRGYCLFLCPMGRFQELIGGAQRYFPSEKDESPTPLPPAGPPGAAGNWPAAPLPSLWGSDMAGVLLLWGGLVALAFNSRFPAEKLEAFTALFVRNQGVFGWVFVGVILLGCLGLKRFYCRLLCPLNPLFADIEALRHRLRK